MLVHVQFLNQPCVLQVINRDSTLSFLLQYGVVTLEKIMEITGVNIDAYMYTDKDRLFYVYYT